MRIFHTSDWHLGQHFMGKSRESEHQAFLDWLLETVESERADALVVAGDIYDTGTPPSYARAMFNRFIVSLRATACRAAVFVGGNHDSAATLNEARELLACLDTHVAGKIMEDPADHLIPLARQDGTPGVVLCAVPFIRPRDLIQSTAGQSGREKKLALAQAISRFYKQQFNAARAAHPDLSVMATAHLTVLGGKSSESVREIYIGSLEAFNANLFPGFDYIALGHLHQGQKVSGSDLIQYSGSPIPLSFDEGKKEKQLLCIDFSGDGQPQIKSVRIPCFRRLLTLSGSLEEIAQTLSDLPEPVNGRTSWLEVEVAEDAFLPDLTARVQAMIENQPLELLRIRRKKKKTTAAGEEEIPDMLEEMNEEEVFQRRLDEEEMDRAVQERLMGMFREVTESVRQGGELNEDP